MNIYIQGFAFTAGKVNEMHPRATQIQVNIWNRNLDIKGGELRTAGNGEII